MRKLSIGLLLLVLLLVPSTAFADRIVLKSGAEFTGIIEEETEDEVVIRTGIGRMRFGRDLVEKIVRDRRPASSEGDASAPPLLAWKVKGVLPDVAPVLSGRNLVLPGHDGGVFAVDVARGERIWSSEAGGRRLTGLAADAGAVYVATTDGDISRLDPRTGSVLWRARVVAPLRGAPLIHRRGLFVYGPGHGLHGIEPASGKIRGLLRLDARLDTPLSSAEAKIVAGAVNGRLLVLNQDGTAIADELETPGGWAGRPVATSLRAVVLAGDDKLVVYDPEACEVVRRIPIPKLRSPPLGASPTRAFAMIDGVLSCLDLLTGRTVWRARELGRVGRVTVTGNHLLAIVPGNRLVALARADGKTVWTLTLPAPAASIPLYHRGRSIVVDRAGLCRAYGELEILESRDRPVEPGEPEGQRNE